MKKKYLILVIVILVLSIAAILIGIFYPKSTNKPKKEDKFNCVITKEKDYYRVEYNSDYDNYSVVEGMYEVVNNKDDFSKKLNKINCDISKIDVDFSKEKLVFMETLITPKIEEFTIKKDMIRAFVSYDLDNKNNSRYNLFVAVIDKKIKDYDIRIYPKSTNEESLTNK